jgi:tetratricopeptide (TPR) repeat protein
LSAWWWLADGLIDYFESVNERAHNRVQRAHALAASAKSPRIQALTAAWCAHLDLRIGDIQSVVRHVTEALQSATPDNHSALSRACVVVAGVYQGCDREIDAQPWYARARSHATLEGDGVTLSSIMYNMAAMRIVNTRLAEQFGTLDRTLAKRALLGAESSSHLDQAVQARALTTLSWMQRAQILCVLGEHAEALRLFERHYDEAISQGLAREEAQLLADRAWCLLRLGRGDESRNIARSAAAAITWATEADGRAVAHAQLARTFGGLGLTEEAAAHAQQAHARYAEHQAVMTAQRAALDAAQLDRYYPQQAGGPTRVAR